MPKTTTMSESNNELILAWKSPRIKRFVLPLSILEEDSNGLSALLDKSVHACRSRFKSGTIISHLLYMNEIMLYAKNEQNITWVFQHRPDIWSGKVLTPHCQQRQDEEHLWNQPTRGSDR